MFRLSFLSHIQVEILGYFILHWNKLVATVLYCSNTFSAVGLTDTYADKLKSTPKCINLKITRLNTYPVRNVTLARNVFSSGTDSTFVSYLLTE
jgi:hypothetical protein